MEAAYPTCRFYVEMDNDTRAVFTEVSGLQMETEVEEHPEGGNNSFVHYLPGRTKVGRLTLKRGIVSTNDFLDWYSKIVQGDIEHRNLSIVVYDVAGTELIRRNILKAFPVKWVGPQLTADGSMMAVETIELVHEGMTFAASPR